MHDAPDKPLDLQIEQHDRSAVERELKVSVPAEYMAKRVQDAMSHLARKAVVPGFRQGHIPQKVLVRMFGKAVTDDTVQDVLQHAYRQALDESRLHPLAPAAMKEIQFEEGHPLTFTVNVEIMPEFELPELSQITVELPVPRADEEDVLRALDDVRESRALLETTEDPVAADSVITVDLQELDTTGVPILNRGRKGVVIDLNRDPIGEFFRHGVIGLRLEQSGGVELPVRSQDKEPKTARFQVTIRNIQRKTLLPLDDSFASTVNSRMTTLDELREDLKRYLEARAAHRAREEMLHRLADDLLRRTDFPVPPRMLDEYLDRLMKDGRQRETKAPEPQEIERFKTENRASATWNLRWFLVTKKLTGEQELQVTDPEFELEIKQLASIDGVSVSVFKRKLSEQQEERIREDLRERKLLAYLESQVNVVPRPVSLAEFEGRQPSRIITT